MSIGLVFIVALMQTLYVVKKKTSIKKMAKFWGHLFLLNFAVGVVTGILQEFQFGMNWSDYSRFVGDVFGAPLAIEALLAFSLNLHLLDFGYSAGIVCRRRFIYCAFGLFLLVRSFRRFGFYSPTHLCRNQLDLSLKWPCRNEWFWRSCDEPAALGWVPARSVWCAGNRCFLYCRS